MCYTLMTRDNTRYNSRSLLRRATPLAVEPLDDALATTHALLRRATQHGTFLLFVLWCYNSRSPAESDVIERSIFTLSNRYNSRSPAESDIYNAIVRQLS